MKRIFLFSLVVLALLSVACNKAGLLLYNSPANVYFDFTESQRDSLLYTFAYEPSRAADTIYLPVKLSGIRVDTPRKFIIKIDPDSTTAVPYKNFKPLDSVYTLEANSGICRVPLIIYNTDTLLQTQSVQIKFSLYPTHDLGTDLTRLKSGRLVFSSKLERPDWWGMWMGDYFSQIKYRLFIIVTGKTSLTTGSQGGLDAPKNLYFVSLLTSFLDDPFAWISDHPKAGYVMIKSSDGSYEFYNIANPQKKIWYKYDSQAGKYFFIDENGLEVH